jgi:putative ABC transport system permease protein
MRGSRKPPRHFRLPWRSREQIDNEVDEEIRFHLDMRAEELIRAGMDPEQARDHAKREFGNVDEVRGSLREADEEMEEQRRRSESFADLRRDVRFALRMLARRRGFASATILTLAIGIGAATAMFSIADGVLLRPLPVEEQERVVVMVAHDPTAGMEHLPFPFAAFRAFREQSRALSDIAALDYHGGFPRPVRFGGEATNLNVAVVTGDFFRVLGVEPAIGRGLQLEDDHVEATPVVAISYGLWKRRFGGNPAVLGRTVELMGHEAVVVGVMPRGFEYPQNTEVWAPTLPFTAIPGTDSSHVLVHMVGRLAPGATAEQARSELHALLRSEDAPLPPVLRDITGVVRPLEEHLLGGVRPLVWALLGAVGLLLLITIVNAATLLLGRAVERTNEFAIRASLGASAGRLRVQVITESLVLALIGGLLAVAIAYGLVRVFGVLAPSELPRADAVRIDTRVLLFALAVSLGTAFLFGLVPAIRLARDDLAARLRTGSRGGTATREARLTQRALVVAQVALALVVLTGAGLVVRSLSNLQRLDWGVAKEQLLLVQFSPPDVSAYRDKTQYRARTEALIESIEALPGVASAVPTLMPPFGGTSGWDAAYALEGQAPDEQESNPMLNLEVAAPGYFRTLGIALLRGRAITEEDREDSPAVAVVSESMARLAWSGEDPIGKRIRIGGENSPWRTVIGVARDTRYRELTGVRPTMYLPRDQFPTNPGYLAVRVQGDPGSVGAAVRHAGGRAWPGASFPSIQPLSEYASEPLARPRFAAALFAAFALVSLLLASIGLYGVMGAHVLQRTREIGIRMALGANRGDVMRAVLGRGMLLALAGAGIGIVVALVLTRLLASILYGVEPTDSFTFVAVTVLLAGVSLLASYLPARRATHVDPVVVLRAE